MDIGSIIVKCVVIALCLLFMVFVIWKLYQDSVSVQEIDGQVVYWPPEINRCPDYWTYENDGKCHNNGSTVNALTAPVGATDLKTTCDNMKKLDIPWEGIDNLC